MASYEGKDWIPILREAADEARRSARNVLKNRRSSDTKELKRLLDIEAENAIEKVFRRRNALVHVVSEDSEYSIGETGRIVILDPVDGTTNLAKGLPFAVTSLAVSESRSFRDESDALVMVLRTGKTFWAKRGKGSWGGRARIRSSGAKPLGEMLLSMDISKGSLPKPANRLLAETRHLRQFGCSALSLCLVASGVLDAHVDLRGTLRATDIAAGLFILKEAGGAYCVNGVEEGDFELSRQSRIELVAASSHGVLEDILRLIG